MPADQDAVNKGISDQIKNITAVLKALDKELEDLKKRVSTLEKKK